MYHVLVITDDLYFRSRITLEASRVEGSEIRIVDTPKAALQACSEGWPHKVLVDGGLDTGSPIDLIKQIREMPGATGSPPSITAYFSHIDMELAKALNAAGADQSMAKSQFVEKLPKLLTQPASQSV